MLQCQIWGRETGNAGKWEALTQGTPRKKKICRSIPAGVSAQFLLSELKKKSVECGQSVAWLNFGELMYSSTCSKFGWSFFDTISHPHFYTIVAG